MTTTAIDTETVQQQLTQEIMRVTGIIKVNFPSLYSTLYETPAFISFEEEHMEQGSNAREDQRNSSHDREPRPRRT